MIRIATYLVSAVVLGTLMFTAPRCHPGMDGFRLGHVLLGGCQ
jgi:hypothetical protein